MGLRSRIFHVTLLAASAACHGPMAASIPATADSLFATLRPAHPRLLLEAGTLDGIREAERAGGEVPEALRHLRRRADSLLAAPVAAYAKSGGKLLPVSRMVLDRVLLLAFLARYDGGSAWSGRALRELEAAARFPDWNPSHFLDVAEMAAAFAIGYDWLHDQATASQRAVLREALRSKAFAPALAEFEARRFWTDSRSNWNAVCNSGLVLAALALGDEEPSARALLHRALLSLRDGSLEGFAPDGDWAEGVGYWCYTGQYLSKLVGSLRTALGNDFGLAAAPGLSETGLFPIYMEGPTGRMFNFADSRDARIFPYWMNGFARAFGRPEYARFARRHTGIHVLDLIWYQPPATAAAGAAVPLPLSRRFRGTDLAVFRSAWDDSVASWLALKAGNPAGEHAHLDAGTFVYEAMGRRWAVDLGPDDYALPGYFTDFADTTSRFNYYRVRAEGSNTLVIDPRPGPDQERGSAAGLLRFDAAARTAVADLTPAYRARALRVHRGAALRADGSALFQDEVLLAAPGTLAWRMHTEAAIALAADGRSARLTLGGKTLWAALLSPAGARFASLRAEPLPSSPRPAGQAANAGISVLSVQSAGVQAATVAVWLVPLPPGGAPPSVLPQVMPLSSATWQPGTGPARAPGAAGAPRIGRNTEGLRVDFPGVGPWEIAAYGLDGRLLARAAGRGLSGRLALRREGSLLLAWRQGDSSGRLAVAPL